MKEGRSRSRIKMKALTVQYSYVKWRCIAVISQDAVPKSKRLGNFENWLFKMNHECFNYIVYEMHYN